jgi:5-enolpyruvylshikimate-3-phosphate synthase
VTAKTITETDIYGERRISDLVYGVYRNGLITLSIRKPENEDMYRVRLKTSNDLEDLADELESLGYNIYSDAEGFVIIGRFNGGEVSVKLERLLEMLT